MYKYISVTVKDTHTFFFELVKDTCSCSQVTNIQPKPKMVNKSLLHYENDCSITRKRIIKT